MFETAFEDRFAVGEEFLVSTGVIQGEQNVQFAPLAGGGFIATWSDSGAVRAQLFDGDGNRIGAEFELASDFGQAVLAALPSGGFIATYIVQNPYPASFDVHVRLFDNSGQPIGAAITANSTLDGFQTNPIITILANGNFVVAWEDAQNTGFDHIRGQLFGADGTKIGGEFAVTSSNPGDKIDPTIISLEGGGFVVSWQDLEVTDQFGNLSVGTKASILKRVSKRAREFAPTWGTSVRRLMMPGARKGSCPDRYLARTGMTCASTITCWTAALG